ncbi:MAG: GDSL-type esterase/lipase family protein [Pseudomonadota bacterium]
MRRHATKTLAALVFLAVAGCSDPRLQPLPDDGVIVAFGDSLTAGVGVAQRDSYPSVLAALTGRRVINAGVSGEVTAAGLARLPDVLAEHRPNLLVLLEGGNDILRNRDLDATQRQLSAMIALAKAQAVDVVLIGVPEKKLFSSSAPLYKALADEHDVVFDADVVGRLLRSAQYKSDQIHFNARGYRKLALAVDTLLRDNGAL